MQQVESSIIKPRLDSKLLFKRVAVVDHSVALVIYLFISIGVTWPLVLNFTTKLIGEGQSDVRHSVWLLWNFLQSVQFRSTPFNTDLLYYPKGISLLLDGVGPLSGFFSLPFWPFGPVAAYNGTVFCGLIFSGYLMYLFARTLNFNQGPAIFAGVVFQLGPAHLAGVYGHLEKTFIGLFPFILLALYKALDPKKSWWWSVVTAVGLLLIALYSGYQFIMAGLSVVFFFGAIWLGAPSENRLKIVKRGLLVVLSSIVIVGPLLISIALDSRNPDTASNVAVNVTAPFYEPDLAQFILPPYYNALFAPILYDYSNGGFAPLKAKFPGFERSATWVGIVIENAVTLSLTALVLCFFTIRYNFKLSRRWLLFTLFCIILSLGPTLRIWGQTTYTAFKLPIILPFAFFDSLPGLEFMRVSGRIMMIGALGLGISAAYGLSWLTQRWPRQKTLIVAVCVITLLVESWPRPWPVTPLPQIPKFYQQIAADKDKYGVFDLPFAWGNTDSGGGWPDYAATYQMYQMVHHKTIAWGYLSHTYNVDKYPINFVNQIVAQQKVEESNLQINGKPTLSYTQQQLAQNNYRYVVYHKTLYHTNPKAREHVLAQQYISAVFGSDVKPFYEDDVVKVYKIEPNNTAPQPGLVFSLGRNWRSGEVNHQWATSPATLEIISNIEQEVTLEISPVALFDPKVKGLGTDGVLSIGTENIPSTNVTITINKTYQVSLKLVKGKNTVTLALEAGNFRPSQYGGNDSSLLSFAVSKINLIAK